MMQQVDFFTDLDQPQQQPVDQPSGVDFFTDLDQPQEQKRPFPFSPGGEVRVDEGPETTPGRLAAQVAGLGAKFVKYPLELLKQAGIAEALQELDDLEMRGIPVDREKYLKTLYEHAETFPSQEKIEKYIEEKTGLPLEPKSKAEKKLRELFEFSSLSPEKILGKLGFGATSSAVKTHLVDQGLPEPIADVLALGVAAKFTGRQAPSKMDISRKEAKNGVISDGTPPAAPSPAEVQVQRTKGPTQDTKIGEKYGLRPFAGTEIEKPRGFTPIISRTKAKKIGREVTDSAKRTAHAIVKENIPAAKARAQGLDLEKTYSDYYRVTRERAANAKNPVDMSHVVEWMDAEIEREVSRVPSLSPKAKKKVSILKKERKKLVNKKLPAQQTTDQFHEYSDRVNGLWEKSERTGLEQAEAGAYQDIKDQLVSAMKKSGNEEVARPFEYANEVYKQTANLKHVESILSDAFRSPSGLKTVMKGGNRGHLIKALGKDAVQQLDEIAKYQTAVVDRMRDFVKTKDASFNLRKWGEIIMESPGRLAGLAYTGKNTSNKYIKFQKTFLAKDYTAAEKLAEDLVKNLATPGDVKKITGS